MDTITAEQLFHGVPIDIEQFESTVGIGESTSERIVRFLLTNEGQAYTRTEIADAIDVTPETVGTNLTRLKDRGLVRHREPYWAFTDDHEQARAVLIERGADDLAALLSERTREDSPEDDTAAQERPISSGPDSPHRAAASAFVDRVCNRLDDAVDAIYVFGSVARRTESTTSDVDVLVVIEDGADFGTVDDHLLDIAFDVQLEYDVRIEVPQTDIDRELERAEQMLTDATKANEVGISKATVVNRLYYACFHAAQAALYTRGWNPQSHGPVQTLLGRELVRNGDVSREFGRFFNDMETYRRRVDYGSGGVEREATELIDRTAEFIAVMRQVVENGLDST